MRKIILMLSALAIIIAGCSSANVQQSFYSACAAYSSALTVAAMAREQGALSPGAIRAINGANVIVIGDPEHAMPGLCTTSTPPADFATAAGEVLSRLASIQAQLSENVKQ